VFGIASMEWRVISKNFHGKHTAGLFLKERGWGTDFLPIKGTSNPSSTCNEEENLLLVPYSWMGSARGKNGIREMYKGVEGEEKDRYLLPFFFSYAFLSLASLAHIVNLL
jgi:hypothetical protein